MDNANCYPGIGCTVNLTGGGADICWNAGGYITGKTSCNVKDVGFCQGINQTAYVQTAAAFGYPDVTCKRSQGAKSVIQKALLVLVVLAGLVNAEISLDDCTTKALQYLNADNVNASYPICGTYLVVDDIDTSTNNITTSSNETDSSELAKRIVCASVSYTQVQVVRTGLWWDVWAPDGNCVFCGYSDQPCQKQLSWSDSETYTYNAGFNAGLAGEVTKLINSNPGLSFGFSWSTTKTDGGSVTCTAGPGENVQTWVQNRKGWSDSQTRRVTENSCGGIWFGPWSAYQHADFPLMGDVNRHYGCSTGKASGC